MSPASPHALADNMRTTFAYIIDGLQILIERNCLFDDCIIVCKWMPHSQAQRLAVATFRSFWLSADAYSSKKYFRTPRDWFSLTYNCFDRQMIIQVSA